MALFDQPFDIDGQSVRSRPSVGIAFGTSDDEGAELLRNADIAMYLAKSQGKGRYELFRTSLHAEVVSRLAVRASLQRAIEQEQLVVHYQPIVDLATEATVALEALVRWNHPERGLIPPAEFIPVAEATGLIVPLGRWVLRTACRQMAEFVEQGLGVGVSMSVNVSPVQLRHPDLLADIRIALAESGLPPSLLVLEVTEGVINDLDAATGVLDAIRALGVHIAIDDFGTGHSALSYLSRFPVEHIKIDRSFIASLGGSERETALITNVLAMAREFHLGTVAEGIETPEQLELLRRLGCRFGQGYLFSRPGPAEEIQQHLKAGPSAPSRHAGQTNVVKAQFATPI